jgi:hypothetical protein
MKRYRQTTDEILQALSTIETTWIDDHSEAVMQSIEALPQKPSYGKTDIEQTLDKDFDAGITTLRLALEMSKDEFFLALKAKLGSGGTGITRYRRDRNNFISALVQLGILEALGDIANKPVSWKDILIERLKAGRGSAIKGQLRGRFLEDRVEEIIERVFSEVGYDVRCRFTGASGTSTEKTDFAIPTKEDPHILIEVKA